MTVNRRSKKSRLRGSHTHGWGAKKKHRGAGHRGGRGNAGSGKRADAKKPSYWKDLDYFGKHGFIMHGVTQKFNPVNLSYFEEKLDKFVANKEIEFKNGFYHIDITKFGFNKLLGSGKGDKKLKINAPFYTAKAKEKVESSGGEIISEIPVETTEASVKTKEPKKE